MGTRSITRVFDDNARTRPVLSLYRQMDGYPSGHGAELKEFLNGFEIINGIPMGVYGKAIGELKVANGMSCLAAQVVAHFKTEIGQFYVTDHEDSQEYVYDIYPIKDEFKRGEPVRLCVRVWSEYRDRVLYEGEISEFDPNERSLEE